MEPPKPEAESQSHVSNGHSTTTPNGSGSEPEPKGPKEKRTASSTGSTKKSVHWSPDLVTESTFASSPNESRFNQYFSSSYSQPAPNFMETVVTVRNVLGRWGRKVGEATKKAESFAGNTWQHLKTSPSFAEAAMGRIAQGTKVLAEGGYEKIFLNTFETGPEERLQNSYACYLSTSAGPVMGVLYVVIPLQELKAVHSSSNTANSAEKYIQVISVDNHEFWFMGFLNYDGALECLYEALDTGRHMQSQA
ncbi:hypothetical protein PHAVU_003G289800 [Phaseolus vulgaris]